MYKIIFFTPTSHAESIKQSVFNAGAGAIGNYSECCWETEGVGQFKPMPGSEPFIGSACVLERVPELKVEMVCDEQYLHSAIKALKQAHPYEEPAYEVIKLVMFPDN